jgi:ubiquinone/menaquinone biosynthesis C-methylase UbiE
MPEELLVTERAQTVFAQRASFYTTSPAHTDKTVLDRVVELARPKPIDLVLDVATGTGHTAFALAPHVHQVIAIDLTPEMIAQGEKLKAASAMQNVEFRIADAHALPFDDGTFDLVTCRRAAHHFVNLAGALHEMKRVLRIGGRLIVDDRSVPEDDFVDVTMNHLDVLHDRSHVREYRPHEWERMLLEAGFSVEAIEPYIRHRPLSALTEKADPEDAIEIETRVAALNDAQRKALNVVEKEGELYLNHWFVMIAAVKMAYEK